MSVMADHSQPPSQTATIALRAALITVVLADDHHQTRGAVRGLLEREGEVEVLAEACDWFTTLRLVAELSPQVLLLDLGMPVGSGLATIQHVRAEAPETAVVVVTMRDDASLVRAALEAGAIGYVLTDHAGSELAEAIRCAVQGRPYVSPAIAGLDALGAASASEALSQRETDVLRLVALGHSNAEIAERLRVSARTVESHRQQIYGKLGLSRRRQLVAYAREHGLIERRQRARGEPVHA